LPVKYNAIIIRFGSEIGTKSPRVKVRYEKSICDYIRRLLEHHSVSFEKLEYTYGRAYLFTNETSEASELLTRVFGISSFSPAISTTSDIDQIADVCVSLAKEEFIPNATFAVRCRRVGTHPYTSLDVNRIVGERILSSLKDLNLKVDLENPMYTMGIEIREDKAFIFLETIEGPGGFPIGSQGRVVCLISGGIDSPVAAWLMMRRGCIPVFLHFDLGDFGDKRTRDKVTRLVRKLSEWMFNTPLRVYIVPHGENLQEIKDKCMDNLTCVLCKRVMYRVAERIAEMEGAVAIVTGEAIGEQASQTLHNLAVIEEATKGVPVIRPLVTFEKVETERLARRIGTYEISAEEEKGCAAAPKRPSTRARMGVVLKEEQKLDIERMVEIALERAEKFEIKYGNGDN